ncbi:MAG: ParA family protein [Kangiellaceae bacterium]|jgi:chromosome partitioning protein|nr:ParA family protein [Kangiellaceae bacterium]
MAAKIIALAQAKGGVGKTTLCVNLATTFCDLGRVLIIDCDPPQHSIVSWNNVRESSYEETGLAVESVDKPAQLLKLLEKVKTDYDFILLDGPPHINSMTRLMLAAASMVLVPLAPSQVEIWSFDEMDKLMAEVRKVNPNCEARIVWTRVRTRVKSSEYLIEDVRKSSHIKPLSAQLTQRVAYVDSFAEGVSVYEWPDPIARAELWSLFSMIQRLLKKCPEPNFRKTQSWLSFSK